MLFAGRLTQAVLGLGLAGAGPAQLDWQTGRATHYGTGPAQQDRQCHYGYWLGPGQQDQQGHYGSLRPAQHSRTGRLTDWQGHYEFRTSLAQQDWQENWLLGWPSTVGLPGPLQFCDWQGHYGSSNGRATTVLLMAGPLRY